MVQWVQMQPRQPNEPLVWVRKFAMLARSIVIPKSILPVHWGANGSVKHYQRIRIETHARH